MADSITLDLGEFRNRKPTMEKPVSLHRIVGNSPTIGVRFRYISF